MKVSRKGTVKLEPGEIRIGNFFVKDERKGDLNAHIKITDINSAISHRVWKRLPVGLWLTNMLTLGDDGKKSISVFIGAMWSLFSVVPDDEFIGKAIDISREALERHPDWYGDKPDATDKEHEEALEEVKAVKEFEEAVKKIGDDNED